MLEHLEYIQYNCINTWMLHHSTWNLGIHKSELCYLLVFSIKLEGSVMYLHHQQWATGVSGFGLNRHLGHYGWQGTTVLCRVHLASYTKEVCSYLLEAISAKDKFKDERWKKTFCWEAFLTTKIALPILHLLIQEMSNNLLFQFHMVKPLRLS